MTPQPPVELTCATHASALTSLLRLAHNALSVALLASRNVTRPGVHTGAPNVSKVHAVGGSEVQSMESLQGRIDDTEARHALALPDSPEREMYARQLERMDRHMQDLRDQLEGMDTGKRVTPGLRDTYRVTIPALHARVAGVMYVSDCVTVEVEVDPETPRYEEFLGRRQHTGHESKSKWPLYQPKEDKTNMRPSRWAEDWHFELIARLWNDRPLPALVVAQEIAATGEAVECH